MKYRSWLITVGLFLALILSLQLMSAESNVMAASESEVELLQGGNLALNQPVVSSSNENDDLPPENAVDGDPSTRWASEFSDPQWIYVDLGASVEIDRVLLNWEGAYSSEYELQVSDDATNWTTIHTETAGDGGVDDITGLNAMGRYVRMYGTARGTIYGHSLWEFEVYGAPQTAASFAEMFYSVEEGNTAMITVTLNIPSADNVTVDYATSADTATAGDDYTETTGTVTFSPGETTQSFTVATIDDDDAERSEHVMLTLSNVTNANLGGLNEARLIINDDEGFPYQDASLPVEERVNNLLSLMTLDEKIGQMTQVESGSLGAGALQIRDNMLGSVLSGGGGAPATGNTPEDWADRYDEYQELALSTPLGIPLIYGVDAVHGHSNVNDTTIFPHNIGLGATRNPDLIEEIGHITAVETRATGIPWNFAPCICVARDDRWGRTYESFGEDPEIAIMMTSIITGYQGTDLSASDRVLATAKHYVGDGGTTNGTDQGNTELTEAELRAIHLSPFEAAIEANVGSIMPSYSSWNGVKLHGDSYLINEVLKDELGFDGFIISDWAAIDQIPGDYNSDVRTSINAGLDMIMTPYNGPLFIDTLREEVNANNVSMERIDDAVSRILTKKFELGLFEAPYADRSKMDDIGSPAHRDVARQAVRESLVLLKNADNLLPLEKDTPNILVAGSNADDIGHQSGGWTITWQGGSGDTTEGTTILEGISDIVDAGSNVAHITYPDAGDVDGYDLGIVVVGEPPYAEGVGDDPDLQLNSLDVGAINQVCGAMPCVVVLVSGRPMIINDELAASDAFVAAWLPGTEGDGIAEVLFGDYDFTGTLPMSWPRNVDQHPINVGDEDYDPLFEYGYGLVHDATDAPLTVSFARSNYPVEEGEAMTLTARLNKAFTDTVTVMYSTADGTATDGEDYNAASGTLTFPAGTTMQSFTVETLDDNVEEDNETVNLTLSSPTNAALGDRDEAMITIEDNDGFDSIDFPERHIINDYENGVPVEHFTWGNGDNVTLETTVVMSGSRSLTRVPDPVPAQGTTNSILQVNYDIPADGWGGFTNDYSRPDNNGTSRDWSAYEGISFWLHGSNTGEVIRVEIQDNRNPDFPDDDTAERFIYDGLVDNYAGWQFFNIPFTEFSRRADWQPGNVADDGELGLTEMWGYAFLLPAGTAPQVVYFDDFALNLRTPIIDDFESGVTGEHFTYGEGTVTTIAMDVGPGDPLAFPGQIETNSILSVTYDIGNFGGLGRAFEQPQNWSLRAGFSFWFYGMNTGNIIQVEIQDNKNPDVDGDTAERFDYEFNDNFEGWRHINIPFAWFTRATDFQPGDVLDDGLTLTEMWGYAIVLEPNTSGAFYMDDVELVRGYDMLEDFESSVPDNFVTWGNQENNVTLTTTEVMTDSPLALPFQEGPNSILQANYDIPGGGWGGFTSDYVENGQRNWTSYDGFSFWLYGNNTGLVVRVEIQDNLNPNAPGDTAERFAYDEIIDDYTGWKFISIPFDAFQRRGDWQPPGALDDGFGLNEVSGYAITFPPNVGPQVAYMDDVQLFGLEPEEEEEPELSVGFDNTAIQVHEGDTATITVTLNMTSSLPVTVTYTVSDDTAMAGSDYGMLGDEMPMSGTLVFEANSTSQSFTVATIDDTADEMNETVSLRLSHPMNAALGASQATLTIQDDDEVGPEMVDDFAHVVWSEYQGSGYVTLTTTNVMSSTDMAVPGQDMVNSVLHVSYDIPAGETAGFTRTFQVSQDWSTMGGVNFWFHGSNSGETMTVEIQDNGAADPGPSGWTLAWSDEFDGAAGSAPDPTKWTAEVGDGVAAGNAGWGNAERQYYTDSTDNAALDGNGNLVMTARALDTSNSDMECYYGPCEYTSARLITENKAEFTYGRIEARLKVPEGQGLWPAFWTLGNNFRDVGWPNSGEIDIMENIGREPATVHGTIHGPGYSGGNGVGDGYDLPTGNLADDFHVFAIEWQPEQIRWSIDNTNYYTATPADLPAGTNWVYDHPFFLLLNVAVGGYWPGYPDDSTTFPQTMEVDYVRVYQAADTAERFEATFTNDFTGWQKVSIPFTSFTRSASQPVGAPDDGLTLTEVWGYGLKLTANSRNSAQSSGTFMVDEVQLGAAEDPTNVFVTEFGPQTTTSQPLGELAALLLAISAGILLWRRRKNA
ncbi:MAG: carbohydrate binding domain-containing protein [Ardenticatenaceae bacterium]